MCPGEYSTARSVPRRQDEDQAPVNGALGGSLGVERQLGWSHVPRRLRSRAATHPTVADLTHAAGACFFEEGARQRRGEKDRARLRGLAVGVAGPSEHDVDLLIEDGFDDEARRSLAEVEGRGRGGGRAKGAQLLA